MEINQNDCPICPFVKTGQMVKSVQSDYRVEINRNVDCQTKNLIYLISCKKCQTQYVGETARTLQSRISEHLGYIKNQKLTKATGEHFNFKGHKQSDLQESIIEKLNSTSEQFRKQREKMFIQKFNTKYKGLNQKT